MKRKIEKVFYWQGPPHAGVKYSTYLCTETGFNLRLCKSIFLAMPTDKISLFYGGPDECLAAKCGIDFLILEYIIIDKMKMKIE